MKYYLIAGEASGDLHASRLMKALGENDPEAQFRYYGGDLMAAQGGTLVKHYRELAYMGFIPVLLHLPTILSNMKKAKRDICEWRPDALILVDYPGFNLRIARYMKVHTRVPIYYYIAPKIWAWKEWRIKSIKRDIDELFSILPFEVEFFQGKHNYPIHYVGNPTADEVSEYQQEHTSSQRKKVIALLAGSRRQEIKENLPAMLQAAKAFEHDYSLLLAGAPNIDDDYYQQFLGDSSVQLVRNRTYDVLAQAHAALVTSGTATLETALFGVPQVVCYATAHPRIMGWLRRRLLKVKYVSLVNLIADREVVTELVADGFSAEKLEHELHTILDGDARQRMLNAYQDIWHRLHPDGAQSTSAQNAARIIHHLLGKNHEGN